MKTTRRDPELAATRDRGCDEMTPDRTTPQDIAGTSVWGPGGRLLLRLLLGGLLLWNAGMVLASVYLTPRHDFGRFLYSARAYLAGQGMYDWNPTIPATVTNTLDGRTHRIDLWNLTPRTSTCFSCPWPLCRRGQRWWAGWWWDCSPWSSRCGCA